MGTGIRVALVTAPTPEEGRRLARMIVESGLAACVNLLPGITSIYRWEGEVHEEAEVLLVIKTAAARVEELRERIVEAHPYDTPEVIEVEVEGGHAPYLDWVLAESRGA